ncbi:MAG TPA: biopolymer transporter ExbD [Gemmataceae bacterium]|jgi:biopolymer transport protein ExbD|nr:biopolymer transporter ExbD [Gemmataceae bacterium]
MSHGPSTGEVKAEPNLIPLLDVVFQLIMFFMVGVSFVNDQVNENIQLPSAQSARPLDKGETDVLFLNLNKDGQMEVVGQEEPKKNEAQIGSYLKQEFTDRKARNEQGKVNTMVILRADKGVEYKKVYQVLRKCKDAGFTKLQLRALTKG